MCAKWMITPCRDAKALYVPRLYAKGINGMVKIRIITPLSSISRRMLEDTMAEVKYLEAYGIICDHDVLGIGPADIEDHFDEACTAPLVAIKAMQAEKEGIDAVIIDCMGDPGLMATRQTVRIPVIGPGEASMHVASMLGHRFSCVSIMDSVRPIFFDHARIYGVGHKLASVRTINKTASELEALASGEIQSLLLDHAMKAVREDHVDSIILGCTGFVGVANFLEQELAKSGMPVQVINPLPTAALIAATMVWGKMTHSAHGFHKPNFGKYTGFNFGE